MKQQIEPAYVTFEQYESYCDLEMMQFLYNKGFRFKLFTEEHEVVNNLAEQRFNEGDVTYCKNYITFSIVCEWLRINHGIWVYVNLEGRLDSYSYFIKGKDRDFPMNKIIKHGYPKFNEWYISPQEAYSAAFDYILNELI
jgi:hypothetical protein